MIAGVRQRARREREERLTLAWECAALGAAAQAGKLRPIEDYLNRARPGGGRERMIEVLREAQARGAPMTIRKIERSA